MSGLMSEMNEMSVRVLQPACFVTSIRDMCLDKMLIDTFSRRQACKDCIKSSFVQPAHANSTKGCCRSEDHIHH